MKLVRQVWHMARQAMMQGAADASLYQTAGLARRIPDYHTHISQRETGLKNGIIPWQG